MKKILKIFFSFLLILICIIIALSSFIFFKKNKIIDYFIEKANSELGFVIKKKNSNLKIDIFNYSLGLNIKDLDLKSTNDSYKINLKASSFFILLNVLDTLKGKYNINLVKISDGKIQLSQTNKISNKNITKTLISNFGLDKIILKNIEISYPHDVEYISDNILIESLRGKMYLKNNILHFKVKGDCLIKELIYEKKPYLTDYPIKINTDFSYNILKHSFETQKALLSSDNLIFKIYGILIPNKKINANCIFDIAEVKNLFNIIPPNLSNKILKFDPKGKVKLKLDCVGDLNQESIPKISIDIDSENIQSILYKTNTKIEKIKGNIIIPNYKNLSTAYMKIKLKRVLINDNALDVDLKIKNFKKYNSETKIIGILDSSVIGNLIKSQNLDLDGNVFIDLKISKIKDSLAKINGKYIINNFKLKYNNAKIIINDIVAKQNQESIQIEKINMKINNKSVRGNLSIDNIYQTILNQNGKFININGQLYAQILSLTLIKSFFNKNLSSSSQKKIECEENAKTRMFFQNLLKKLIIDINCEIDKIDFYNFKAENVNTNFRFRNYFAEMVNTRFISSGGKVQGYGFYNFEKSNKNIGININLKRINLDEVFENCSNFGQDFIINKNIKGKIFADIVLQAKIRDNYLPNWQTLEGSINAVVNNGQLLNFEPLKSIESYLDPEHLKIINFPSIKAKVTIKNKKVIIPETEIDSSVTKFKISGEHDFKNNIHYKMILPMKKNFKKSIEQKTKTHLNYNDEDLQGLKLYLNIKGKSPDFKVSYNITSSVARELKTQSGHFGKIFIGKFKKKEESQHLTSDDTFDFD